ncbi:MAG: NifB/NifX family molybdenum-iron cluster-binding protein [Lentisphaeria bacterium]|nr:NifB/NifX family molybdenum-iron cluster-binding protein [Lentisphaeria bacterium]
MKAAFAVKSDNIADTLGSAQSFLLLADGQQKVIPCQAKCNMLRLLQQHGAEKLICNRIGNCMIELFQQHNIEVIAGVSGNLEQVIGNFLQGTLVASKNFTCTENGQICGDCPGNF